MTKGWLLHLLYVDLRCISVCKRWHDFENFYTDMGDPPPGLQLERKENNGNYEPDNCHWVTHKQQMQNTRSTFRVAIDDKGETWKNDCFRTNETSNVDVGYPRFVLAIGRHPNLRLLLGSKRSHPTIAMTELIA